MLGELHQDVAGVRRFKKLQGRIAVNTFRYREQFKAACNLLKLTNIDIDTILPEESFESPTIVLYRRIFSRIHVELFEAIQKGCELTMEWGIRDDLPRSPSLEQFSSILSATGKYLGLSQFGTKFGFGRFNVMSVKECNHHYHNVNSSGAPPT